MNTNNTQDFSDPHPLTVAQRATRSQATPNPQTNPHFQYNPHKNPIRITPMPLIPINALNAYYKKYRKSFALTLAAFAALCAALAIYGHIDLYLANRQWIAAGGSLQESKTTQPNIPLDQNAAHYYAQASIILNDEDPHWDNVFDQHNSIYDDLRQNRPIDISTLNFNPKPKHYDAAIALLLKGTQQEHCDISDLLNHDVPQDIQNRFPDTNPAQLKSGYQYFYNFKAYVIPRLLIADALASYQRGDKQRTVQMLLATYHLSNHKKPSGNKIKPWEYYFYQQEYVAMMVRALFQNNDTDLSSLLPVFQVENIRPNLVDKYIREINHEIQEAANSHRSIDIPISQNASYFDILIYCIQNEPTQLIRGFAPGAANMDIASARRLMTQGLIQLQKPFDPNHRFPKRPLTLKWKTLTSELENMQDFTHTSDTATRLESYATLARLAIQLRQYHATHSRYPDTLSPKTIPAPIEPATGKPITYQRHKQGFTISAAGYSTQTGFIWPGYNTHIIWTWK